MEKYENRGLDEPSEILPFRFNSLKWSLLVSYAHDVVDIVDIFAAFLLSHMNKGQLSVKFRSCHWLRSRDSDTRSKDLYNLR